MVKKTKFQQNPLSLAGGLELGTPRLEAGV